MSASRSAANSPLRCSSHRSAASPSSPDDRQLARARLFLRRKRRTPTGPSSAPSPQQIALNDPLEASRGATAAALSSDRFRHRESISSCLPFSTVTQPALVRFPNQIRIYSQQAPRTLVSTARMAFLHVRADTFFKFVQVLRGRSAIREYRLMDVFGRVLPDSANDDVFALFVPF